MRPLRHPPVDDRLEAVAQRDRGLEAEQPLGLLGAADAVRDEALRLRVVLDGQLEPVSSSSSCTSSLMLVPTPMPMLKFSSAQSACMPRMLARATSATCTKS